MKRIRRKSMAEKNAHASATEEFVTTRLFDAPRELVWQTFTEARHLENWFGPRGFKVSVAKLELRPGGTFLYSMQTPDGHTMWGKWVYREIVAPEKLVTVVLFTDLDGTPVRHPMAATWPLEVLGTMTLAAQGNKTLLTSRSVPINASQVERDTFKAGFSSMTQGFNGTWDQLTEYLAGLKA
jgi:uncharacterized protein YndB with AHSA1/START domain